ncbi:MAG: DNA replication/repair protein RecF, partial [Planctomycetota bacterium]
MHLVWLSLRAVRCYGELEFAPDAGMNVLIGDNGSGKTTVLEAIGYLATLRSFRRSPDSALVGVGMSGAVLRGEFRRGERSIRVEAEVPASGRRRVLVNGKRPAGRAEIAAELPVVTFLPDDLDLVKRGPAYRREYLDDLAAGLRPTAAADQDAYDRALRQRNALLRREGRASDPVTLDVFDDRLASLGAALTVRRLHVLTELATSLTSVAAELDGAGQPLGWIYRSAGVGPMETDDGSVRARLAEALRGARATDMERRVTTVGPHRDEIAFTLGGREIRTQTSQGEQRSVALALRVAAYEMLAARGEAPILLLDDVFSELDADRSARLVERLPDGQVF